MLKKLFVVLLLCASVWAKDNSDRRSGDIDRLKGAGGILDEIMAAPDSGIPDNIIGKADCIAIVPSLKKGGFIVGDRKSTRLNSSHLVISYAVFCLKKKKIETAYELYLFFLVHFIIVLLIDILLLINALMLFYNHDLVFTAGFLKRN